jgi:hypothetical protein
VRASGHSGILLEKWKRSSVIEIPSGDEELREWVYLEIPSGDAELRQ